GGRRPQPRLRVLREPARAARSGARASPRTGRRSCGEAARAGGGGCRSAYRAPPKRLRARRSGRPCRCWKRLVPTRGTSSKSGSAMPVKPSLIRHFLPCEQGRRGAFGTPPVNAFEQHRKLRRGEADLARLGDRPDEPATVHALREEAQALAIIPEQLDQIAALAAEREQRARVRTLLQHLLH